MPVDRGRLRARVLDRQRARQYGALAIKVLEGSKVPYAEIASYSDGWGLEHIEDLPTGADYFKLHLMDLDGTRAEKLTRATAFALSGYVYKRNSADPPKGIIPEWVFKVQPTGARV